MFGKHEGDSLSFEFHSGKHIFVTSEGEIPNDLSDHIQHFSVDIGYSPDDGQERKAGFLNGMVFDSSVCCEDSFFDIADDHDADLYELAKAITDEDGEIREEYLAFDENAVYLDNLYIEPDYRNMGIGSYTACHIHKLLRSANLWGHTYFLIAVPIHRTKEGNITLLDMSEKEAQIFQNRLFSLFSDCGYTRIGDTPFMYNRPTDDDDI